MAEIRHRFADMYVTNIGHDVRIKYKDFFTVLHLYKLMHEWLVFEGWAERYDANFPEELYLQKETQLSGREYWIWWRLQRPGAGKSRFWRWYLDVDSRINLVKDTEVMHEGQKYKTNWGEPDIKLYANLVFDPENELAKNPLTRPFKKIFYQRVLKKDYEHQRKALHRELNRFADVLKKYFQFKTYLPEPEELYFFPGAKLKEI